MTSLCTIYFVFNTSLKMLQIILETVLKTNQLKTADRIKVP